MKNEVSAVAPDGLEEMKYAATPVPLNVYDMVTEPYPSCHVPAHRVSISTMRWGDGEQPTSVDLTGVYNVQTVDGCALCVLFGGVHRGPLSRLTVSGSNGVGDIWIRIIDDSSPYLLCKGCWKY